MVDPGISTEVMVMKNDVENMLVPLNPARTGKVAKMMGTAPGYHQKMKI